MFRKFLIGLFLICMLIGAVSAVDLTQFTTPTDFEDVGDGVYVLYDSGKNPLQILSVVEFTEHDADDYLTNDTENEYTVFEGENSTYNFVDKSIDEKGSFEIIKVGNDKFIIDFAKRGIDNENDFNETFTNLLEFNKLNNVTPLNETI